MTGVRASAATAAALVALTVPALVFASDSDADARTVVPKRGPWSGATAAREPFSMKVQVKPRYGRPGGGRRVKIGRQAWVSHVDGAIPVSCSTGEQRGETTGFPGPLSVDGKGRFSRKGFARGNGVNVTYKVTGRFSGRRTASGTLSYRGVVAGEFCSGSTTWKATRS